MSYLHFSSKAEIRILHAFLAISEIPTNEKKIYVQKTLSGQAAKTKMDAIFFANMKVKMF